MKLNNIQTLLFAATFASNVFLLLYLLVGESGRHRGKFSPGRSEEISILDRRVVNIEDMVIR